MNAHGSEHVELFGRDGFVDPSEYYVTLANSDIVLCPYLADVYKTRSSGIMAEAIIAGKPTVVQQGSWLARQQEPGSGESFSDPASLADAVRSICDRYPEYAARARVVQGHWRENHSPARLVDGLLGTLPAARSAAAKVVRERNPRACGCFFFIPGVASTPPLPARSTSHAISLIIFNPEDSKFIACSARSWARCRADVSRLAERSGCIRSIRVLDVPARKLTLRDLLFGFDRAARSAEFRALAREPFDLFFTNYVMSAPFACALPQSVFKIVETLDVLAGMFRVLDLLTLSTPPPEAVQVVEQRFLFERVEMDLYHAFDRALMISREEEQMVRDAGYTGAVYVPQPFPVRPQAARNRPSFLYDLMFVGSENQLNAHAAFSGSIGIFMFPISGRVGCEWQSRGASAITLILRMLMCTRLGLWTIWSRFTTTARS